jgi:hypothetical protein
MQIFVATPTHIAMVKSGDIPPSLQVISLSANSRLGRLSQTHWKSPHDLRHSSGPMARPGSQLGCRSAGSNEALTYLVRRSPLPTARDQPSQQRDLTGVTTQGGIL